jgi:hypothetical protein
MRGERMNFSMVKICGTKQSNGEIRYESTIMEKGASTPWKNSFESQYELVSIMNHILARQKKARDVRHVLSAMDDGTHYFFDLDLTGKQAESLGWRRTPEDVQAEDLELVGTR